MPQVKVRSRNISAKEAAAAIRDSLGDKIEITPDGDRELKLQQGYLARAKVSISEEPGGTVFDVRGSGPPGLLLTVTMKLINDQGIAKRVAAALSANEKFRDDG